MYIAIELNVKVLLLKYHMEMSILLETKGKAFLVMTIWQGTSPSGVIVFCRIQNL